MEFSYYTGWEITMALPIQTQILTWREEDWSKGILLGLQPDPNSGYRATIWFEYTRFLFNEIREGSLIAVRNFSDRRRNPDGSPAGARDSSYEEYSVLQIDQVHPWHYAIQSGGEQGYPGFTVAAAESARTDWTDMDSDNRDDVSRIKCEAIPLRLAFRLERAAQQLPNVFFDRSMPMPGFEVRLLSSRMTESILNRNIPDENSFSLGRHVVQYEVPIKVQKEDLVRLHFGVFGYTGAGKSNLVSTLVNNLLDIQRQPFESGNRAFKVVLVDLMDEYTGLSIDHLVRHQWSRLIVCGRRALPENVLQACIQIREDGNNREQIAREAAADWSNRVILPRELKPYSDNFAPYLSQLILNDKIKFYEPRQQQGADFDIDPNSWDDPNLIGPAAYRNGANRDQRVQSLIQDVSPLIERARGVEGADRDSALEQVLERINQELDFNLTAQANRGFERIIGQIQSQMRTRGTLPDSVTIEPWNLIGLLNYQPQNAYNFYYPSLTVVIGENENTIMEFMRQVVDKCFENRRQRSILYPTVSFIFDEADVFIAQVRGQTANAQNTLVNQATLLARRGRKFGLGIGIATQRVRYLDTSIMAQPHTYFISKLPRKSDRDAIAEAFAISDDTFEQTFGFTAGQWLVTSHDATGLKGIPFPVQVPNANERILSFLGVNRQNR